MNILIRPLRRILRFSERYTKTDMVYLARSGFWVNLASISVSLFSFVLYLAFAHFLPKEVYGTYQYLLSVSVLIGGLTLTGMNAAVTRSVARGEEGSVRESVLLQLRYGVLPCTGALLLALYYSIQGNQTLGLGLVLIAFFVPFNNALNTYSALPAGKGDFKWAFLLNLLSNTLYYPALIVAAFFSSTALILFAVSLISQCLGLSFAYQLAKKRYRPNSISDPETISYGKHLSVMGLLSTIANQADAILAFHFLGAGPLAIYSFATAIPDRLGNLTKFIQTAAFPKLANKSMSETRLSIGPRFMWAVLAAICMSILYAIFARIFFALFFPAYIESVPYSIAYAFIIVPSLSAIFITALTAQRSVRSLYIFNVVIPIAQLLAVTIGVIFWGLWGLIWARLVHAVIQLVVSAWLFFKGD